MLWHVGPEKRKAAHDVGVYRWSDPACTAVAVGVTGEKLQPILQAILDVNQSGDENLIHPHRITVSEDDWRTVPPLEFYVDYETVSDLDDDFTRIPHKNGQPLIFMIGCGHIEASKWRFRCFVAERLSTACEADVINQWLIHMKTIQETVAPNLKPRVFHWSHAETSNLRDAYNSAVKRHPQHAAAWSEPNWFDFLKQVMRAQPVVVRGALAFGLKPVAQAMYKHHLIASRWEIGPTDGLGAMVGAWRCAREAADKGVQLGHIPLMRDIQQYNEIDCKVMMEVIGYLREAH